MTSDEAANSAGAVGGLDVERVRCLSDNYVWLLHDVATGATAVVDPAEYEPVITALKSKGWSLDYIFNTHHHMDHVGANLQLKSAFPALQIVGPRADHARIPGISVQVGDGDEVSLGSLKAQVLDTPGHTRGHITYFFPAASALFPGDTLFALGCGRVFEGTHEQMWSSLSKLLPLPDDARVYCAHEYTQSNARFAVTVDPDNDVLRQRKEKIDQLRAKGIPTVPSLLGEEKATNPFLRPNDPSIRQHLGFAPDVPDWQVFGAIRTAKDKF